MKRQLLIFAAILLICFPLSARKKQNAKMSNAGTAYIES